LHKKIMTIFYAPIELIGMMDSPFVRRVAIALTHYELPFQLQALSVYQHPERLAAINPLLTVPVLRNASLTLLDSREILAWIDMQSPHPNLRDTQLSAHNLARAASDVLALKAGELYRELGLRNENLHSESSVQRIISQMAAALYSIEATAHRLPDQINHTSIAIATSYRFAQTVAQHFRLELPITLTLQKRCQQWEHLPVFVACDPD
jgi:glutathione S-transferase